MSTTLESLVREWLRQDNVLSLLEPRNKSTRAEIQALWDAGNTEELERRMRWTRLYSDLILWLTTLAGNASISAPLVYGEEWKLDGPV
jgi:hypothetical protein